MNGKTRLDRIPDPRLELHPVEAVDLLDPGRRGDVDLGEVVADDVDADEEQSLSAQCRADGDADLAFARGQGRLNRHAADMEIGPRFAGGRHAPHRTDALA